MSDTSHAALMDRVYRRQRYVYDLTRKYYLFGRDRLIRDMSLREGASVLEVGCGTARNIIAIARRYPSAKLYGLDASTEMLRTAKASLERAGLGDAVVLRHGYAEAVTPALFGREQAFDAIVFSYSLSMIPDWKQALRAAGDSLNPGGKIHVVDFGDLEGFGPLRMALGWWLSLFHVAPREELLRTLEGKADSAGANLRTLPGRYAFLFSGMADMLTENVNFDVAQGSQS
jgi:S-adenosylmethionine-diacylgycerolhomoserine-N-methlytransferase